MLRKTALILACAALGAGASLAVGACGEDRGSVEVEGGGTTGGGTTGATGGETTETGGTTESTGTTGG